MADLQRAESTYLICRLFLPSALLAADPGPGPASICCTVLRRDVWMSAEAYLYRFYSAVIQKTRATSIKMPPAGRASDVGHQMRTRVPAAMGVYRRRSARVIYTGNGLYSSCSRIKVDRFEVLKNYILAKWLAQKIM